MHIPFCKQACTYCNFHFTTSLRYRSELVDALERELTDEQSFFGGAPVSTIYFGGGTPSLLPLEDIRRLLARVRQHYPLLPGAEVTLEANPDDITPERLAAWRSAGINRLSIGVQSFREEELRWMNRAHNADQAYRCIEWSLAAGFDNFSIDLIYGSPLLTDEQWQDNVQTALRYGIPHLSCYALTVEERTPLHKDIRTAKAPEVDSDRQAGQFLLLMQWLRGAGYRHYEVSNFALPGRESRHNSAYWKGAPYLGIGPSAHSFDGRARRWNVAHNPRYIKSVQEGRPEREHEVLTPAQQLNERIMISLRMDTGLHLEIIAAGWGAAERTRLERAVHKYEKTGLLRLEEGVLRLTDEGMLRADGIAADLFIG